MALYTCGGFILGFKFLFWCRNVDMFTDHNIMSSVMQVQCVRVPAVQPPGSRAGTGGLLDLPHGPHSRLFPPTLSWEVFKVSILLLFCICSAKYSGLGFNYDWNIFSTFIILIPVSMPLIRRCCLRTLFFYSTVQWFPELDLRGVEESICYMLQRRSIVMRLIRKRMQFKFYDITLRNHHLFLQERVEN